MIKEFWRKKKEEIEAIEDFGEHAIPMTRLRKIMGAEKGNMLMTFDTPSFLTKACEIFVQELAFRAWMRASSHQSSVILDTDIAEAIATTESYDFLKGILHTFQEEHNSISCSKAISKKPHISTNQPSTSHHSPLNQVPQFAQYPPFVRTPHPLLPTDAHPMSMPFSFPLPQVAPPLMSTIVTPRPIVASTMMAPISYDMATGVFGNVTDTTVISNFVGVLL
jgi:nuclear transcription factor Y, gamma